MKSIFGYTCYRKYLKDYKIAHELSYNQLAKQLGYSSNSFIIEVVQGKKKLSSKFISRTNHGLKHDFDEANYFNAMVMYCNSDEQSLKSLYQTLMGLIKDARM